MGHQEIRDGRPRVAGTLSDATSVGAALITDARHRLVEGFPAQVRDCLERLDETQVWWRPHDAGNAVGNLVLHVCGSTRHFLGHIVGGHDYRRDRPHSDFVANLPLAADRLKELLTNAWEAHDAVSHWPRDVVARLLAEKYGQDEWRQRR